VQTPDALFTHSRSSANSLASADSGCRFRGFSEQLIAAFAIQ